MSWFQSHSLCVQEFAEGLAVLQFDPPGKTLRLTRDVQDEITAALIAVEKESRFRLLMIRSAKPGRFAQGPDIHGWRKLQQSDGVREWSEYGQLLWNRLHTLKIPTLAWIQGACLGPGFELALACDRIVLVNHPSTVLGFHELDLGLIPSWGGIAALVRRAGVGDSLPLILSGRRISIRDAAKFGIADIIATSDAPDYSEIAHLTIPRIRDVWKRRTWTQSIVERFAAGRRFFYRSAQRIQRDRLPDDLPAPRKALEATREFIEHGPKAGQRAATTALVELAKSPAFANLVRQQELRERIQQAPAKPSARDRSVGILGTTPLAMHVLFEVVRAGGSVVLRETDEAKLGIAIMKLVQTLGREIESGKIDGKDSKQILSRIRSTITWKNFDETDLVFDARDRAATLAADAAEVDQNVNPATPIVAVGVRGRLSELDVAHGERFVGLAAPGPIGMFPLVEWRQAAGSDRRVVRDVREWMLALGWLPIEVGDCPGLLVSRLWIPAWNEMIALLREGTSLQAIDRELVRFGLGRGPFDDLDTYGLDHAAQLIEALRPEIEPRIAIDPFWTEVLDRGWRGRIVGKGFYRHGRGRRKPNHLLVNWLRQEGPRHGPASTPSSSQEIRDRVILLTVNEAFRCIDEGRALSEDDLDLAMMLTDWAPHRGGPIRYARDVGLAGIVARLRDMAVRGDRYEPCARLVSEAS